MSAKVQSSHSQMTRSHGVGGTTKIPVAVRTVPPLLPSVSSSSSSIPPSLPPSQSPPQSSPEEQSSQSLPQIPSQPSLPPSEPSSQTSPSQQPSSEESSSHPSSEEPSSQPSSHQSQSQTSPPETGRGAPKRRRRPRETSVTVSAPDALLPTTRAGPPPEDRLTGANTARTTTSMPTARSEGVARSQVMSVTVRAGLQPFVYREGMQYMRDRIAEIHDDLDRLQCQYYHTDQVNEDHFVDYLKECDKHFLRANTELRKRSIKLQVIDSETRLVTLLNQVREDDHFDTDTVQYLTEYWENIKTTVEGLEAVISKFQTNVLNRLKRNYISDSSGDTHLEVCSSFTEDISTHMIGLESTLSNTRILLKSFHSGIHQDLFDKSHFADLIVVSCDLKAFPVLRLVADVAWKVRSMCEVAHQWLVRDEQFMQEIQTFIREARQRTRKREEDLKSQKEKQKKYEKSVKAANILLKNNRDKLHKIETELHVLEQQMDESERDKQYHYDQLQQKESMVDFLKITLSQTKRNYNLQTRRSRLSRQVKDLKELLGSMERDLDAIQGEIQVKAEEKVRLSEKVEHSEKSYDALRCDMDRFSTRVEQLQSEVTDLSSQLLQLEIIHNLKTSPEKVEEIYDRPSTVKLAPSLQEKIKERKRKAKPK